MIALIIIAGILLLLILILLIRVRVSFVYENSVYLSLKILFYEYVILSPDKEKKEKKEKKSKKKKEKEEPEDFEEEEKEKKESLLTKLKNKHGIEGLISIFIDVLKIATGMLKGILSHIVIEKLYLDLLISMDDASATAQTYGKACSAIYPAVSALERLSTVKDQNLFIMPKFDGEGSVIYLDTTIYLRPLFAVGAALKAGVQLLFIYIKEKFFTR